jgi:hypothetical protein
LELNGRGSSAVYSEIEKLQEHFATVEWQNIRCQELQEMLELAEDDIILKAKQAFKAIER